MNLSRSAKLVVGAIGLGCVLSGGVTLACYIDSTRKCPSPVRYWNGNQFVWCILRWEGATYRWPEHVTSGRTGVMPTEGPECVYECDGGQSRWVYVGGVVDPNSPSATTAPPPGL